MLGSLRLRSLLAVDAVATVLAGLLVVVRPGWFAVAVRAVPRLRTLGRTGTVRRAGAAVAVFGFLKGLLYALVLRRGRE